MCGRVGGHLLKLSKAYAGVILARMDSNGVRVPGGKGDWTKRKQWTGLGGDGDGSSRPICTNKAWAWLDKRGTGYFEATQLLAPDYPGDLGRSEGHARRSSPGHAYMPGQPGSVN